MRRHHHPGGWQPHLAGGFSVAQFGSYAPSVVLVAVVVGLGGLVQLWIPAAPSADRSIAR